MDMDKQQIELIGTAALTTALIREGFEVAHPMRDRGIDLIVFSDSPDEPFSALPVQVKAHTGAALMVQRKYEKFKGLVDDGRNAGAAGRLGERVRREDQSAAVRIGGVALQAHRRCIRAERL